MKKTALFPTILTAILFAASFSLAAEEPIVLYDLEYAQKVKRSDPDEMRRSWDETFLIAARGCPVASSGGCCRPVASSGCRPAALPSARPAASSGGRLARTPSEAYNKIS